MFRDEFAVEYPVFEMLFVLRDSHAHGGNIDVLDYYQYDSVPMF